MRLAREDWPAATSSFEARAQNGDPRTPIATLFEAAGLEELRLAAPTAVHADGGAPVARLGDAVQVLTSAGPPYGAIASGRDGVVT